MAIFRNGKEPAERDTRPKVFDARPPAARELEPIEELVASQYGAAEPYDPVAEDIDRIQQDIGSISSILSALLAKTHENKIENIKTIGRSLTYGEMVELADALWAAIPQERELTREMLPAVLHMFATA